MGRSSGASAGPPCSTRTTQPPAVAATTVPCRARQASRCRRPARRPVRAVTPSRAECSPAARATATGREITLRATSASFRETRRRPGRTRLTSSPQSTALAAIPARHAIPSPQARLQRASSADSMATEASTSSSIRLSSKAKQASTRRGTCARSHATMPEETGPVPYGLRTLRSDATTATSRRQRVTSLDRARNAIKRRTHRGRPCPAVRCTWTAVSSSATGTGPAGPATARARTRGPTPSPTLDTRAPPSPPPSRAPTATLSPRPCSPPVISTES
jgi:hypothetical protein